MVDKNVVAVIPARGGSKRIPHKNIIDFMGQPMISWTIKAALESGIFKRVIVSTDDKKIAQVAEDFGVEVPFLRDEYNDDHSPVSQAVIKAVEQAENHYNEKYDTVVQLMANCPIRKSEQIIDAYNNFVNRKAKFQISCFKFGWMNPWWAVKLDKENLPTFLFPEIHGKRSQDLDELYCPTGAIWIADSNGLRQEGTFYGSGYIFHPMNWKFAVDIDNLEDIEMARAVYNMVNK
ncbi:MAG: acylneuraminate cytidylyltransferase family protein [candidate division Zixibacteria bacterium]|nr:acylneuraminate cytidylyltransferase family protein [candidate division Zixibacteria bacterium]